MPQGAFFIFTISPDPFQLPLEVPEIGLPRLTGYLRTLGLVASQQDWNAEFWRDYLLSLPEESYDRLERSHRAAPPSQRIADVEKFFEERRLSDAEQNRRYALVRWWLARDRIQRFDVKAVAAEAARPDRLRDHFHRVKIEKVLQPADPAVVGLSIIAVQQVAPALRLADQIHEALPRVHVVAGGPYFKVGRPLLKDYPVLFDHFDSIVAADGEDAAARLVQAMENGGSLQAVPNLIWRDASGIHSNRAAAPLLLNDLPVPVFDGFPLDLYFSRSMPLQRASRCYWGRCTFCIHNTPGVKLSFLEATRVVEQMDLVHARHGTREFFFIDNCIPGPMMWEQARLLKGRGYTWVQNSRFEEEYLNPDFCRDLYDGGCRLLLFGLETIADRSLAALDKGQRREAIAQTLANCHAAGLETMLYLLVYPGESREELEETWQFCVANRDHIGSVVPQTFKLAPNCIIYKKPEIVGIHLDPAARDNLDFFHLDYTADQQIGSDEFEARAEALARALRLHGSADQALSQVLGAAIDVEKKRTA